MKKSFALAFIVVGLLLSMVSCTPIVRVSVSGGAGGAFEGQTSFLIAAMLLAFACLCTAIGALLLSRSWRVAGIGSDASPSGRGARVGVAAAPLLLLLGIPMVHLLVPLVALGRSRDSHPALALEAKRVLNFQLTRTMFVVVGLILCVVLVGVLILAALMIFQLVVSARAAVAAWRGETASYPLSVAFIP
ncbi:MAG: DUF4870 domain-containing protein [Gammaproteobacteria bacterium]|nr:DUF4870 domain-containing protein [Gammaproteobacteria bacterium]